MNDNYYHSKIKDEKGREGILIEKESIYRKAWFHKNLARWNPSVYGEAGQNVLVELIEKEKPDFLKINIFRHGAYILEVKDLISFYTKNPKSKDIMFRSLRYLFPLSICKKIKNSS